MLLDEEDDSVQVGADAFVGASVIDVSRGATIAVGAGRDVKEDVDDVDASPSNGSLLVVRAGATVPVVCVLCAASVKESDGVWVLASE